MCMWHQRIRTKTFDPRAFAVLGPSIWNTLPATVRDGPSLWNTLPPTVRDEPSIWNTLPATVRNGPSIWNTLPATVRDPLLTYGQFCSKLKSVMFNRAYMT